MELICPICRTPFERPATPGRPPVTCGKEKCRRARKNRKSEESRRRAVERGCPPDMHGTSTGYAFYKCGCAECGTWARLFKQERRRINKHN